MSIPIGVELGTRVSHPIGGAGTIVAYDPYPSIWKEWYMVLFDKTKDRTKPWFVKRYELTEIKE